MSRIPRIEVARTHLINGDPKKALEIASSFPSGLTKEEKGILKLGYEAYVHPAFYKSLGRDIEKCKEEAIALFRSKWMKEKKSDS